MSLKISTVGIVVSDQAKALQFYTDKVGFEKKTDYNAGSYRFVTVGPKGQDLELSLWQVGTKDPTGWVSKDLRPGSGLPIVTQVDDCRRTFADMKSRGVEFKQSQPDERPWGITATFADPDGNLFSINQRPDNTS